MENSITKYITNQYNGKFYYKIYLPINTMENSITKYIYQSIQWKIDMNDNRKN